MEKDSNSIAMFVSQLKSCDVDLNTYMHYLNINLDCINGYNVGYITVYLCITLKIY